MTKDTELNLVMAQTEFQIARVKFFAAVEKYATANHNLAAAMEEAGQNNVDLGGYVARFDKETKSINLIMKE